MSFQQIGNPKISNKCQELLDKVGEDTVKEIYEVIGGAQFTLKPLMDHIKQRKVLHELSNTNKSFREIAEENGVTRMTVWRTFKKFQEQKKQKM